ncbi:hypothetical protein GCM10027093_39060 [Paraburkholderia jirisanensis]
MMDNAFNLVEEASDVAILADYLIPSETVVARRLVTHSYALVAAPLLLKKAERVETPSDLKSLVFLGRPPDRGGATLHLRGTNAADEVLELVPTVICNNAQMLQELTALGCGFSILPRHFIKAALTSGTLIELLPNYELRDRSVDVCLVYSSRKRNSRVASVFIDHLISWFETSADPHQNDEKDF